MSKRLLIVLVIIIIVVAGVVVLFFDRTTGTFFTAPKPTPQAADPSKATITYGNGTLYLEKGHENDLILGTGADKQITFAEYTQKGWGEADVATMADAGCTVDYKEGPCGPHNEGTCYLITCRKIGSGCSGGCSGTFREGEQKNYFYCACIGG